MKNKQLHGTRKQYQEPMALQEKRRVINELKKVILSDPVLLDLLK